MTIEKAIRILIEEYNRALDKPKELIDDPVSFAAWKTWRKAEESRFKEMEKKNGKENSRYKKDDSR